LSLPSNIAPVPHADRDSGLALAKSYAVTVFSQAETSAAFGTSIITETLPVLAPILNLENMLGTWEYGS